MNKKFHFIRNILLFFVLSETVFILFMDWIIQPSYGVSLQVMLRETPRTMMIQLFAIVMVTLIMYLFLTPFKSIIKELEQKGRLDAGYTHRIDKIAKRLITLTITVNVLSFLFFPTFSLVLLGFTQGFIMSSALRLVSTFFLAGPTIAIIQIIFINNQVQKLKLEVDDVELTSIASKLDFRKKFIVIFICFGAYCLGILAWQAIAQKEIVTGLKPVMRYFKEMEIKDKDAYLYTLFELAKNSTDVAVKEEANKVIKNYTAFNAKSDNQIVFTLIIVVLFFSLLVAVYANFLYSQFKGIINRLQSIVGLEGDFTRVISKTSDDEIGTLQILINQLIVNLNKSFLSFYETAREIIEESASQKVSMEALQESNKEIRSIAKLVTKEVEEQVRISSETGSEVLKAVRMNEENIQKLNTQSDMVLKTNASMSELETISTQISQSTDMARTLSDSLDKSLQNGASALKDMKTAIASITEARSDITNSTRNIFEIVDQTNVLAMNAAIEAAHAGEYGKSFSIVAAEIRKLSQNTGIQTNQIVQLLTNMGLLIDRNAEQFQRLNSSMDKMQTDVHKTIDFIRDVDNAARIQQKNAHTGIQVVQELVQINTKIMENLKNQKLSNEKLVETIKTMENTTRKVSEASGGQEVYFEGLSTRMDDLLDVFNRFLQELSVLGNRLSKIKLMDKDFLDNTKF